MTPKPEADVYSFGCLVFFAATGTKPLASWPNRAIQEARRRGDPVLLGFTGTLLLEQSWPLIERATAHQLERRPTMSAIHQELLHWPECHQAMLSTGVDVDLMKSALIEQPAAPVFWQGIRSLRQTLAAEAGPRDLDLPFQLQTRPNLQAPCQQQQHQPAGLAVFGSPGPSAPPRLASPDFAETPMATIAMSIIESMSCLNFPVPRTACCSLHGMAETLESLKQSLPNLP
jgi:hypothetical protein